MICLAGLWTFDLAVNQLLLERVDSAQRGVVNGVQASLNMIMDMLKSVLVIAVPKPEHFGILIILSFCFICFGGASYSIYTYKVDRHILCCKGCCQPKKENLAETAAETYAGNAVKEGYTNEAIIDETANHNI